jgi:rod shape-determining protein MreC
VTFGLLLLTAVSLLVLDLPGTGPLDPVRGALATVLRPVRAVGDAIFRPFGNGWKGAFEYSDVKDQNARLKAELARTRSQDARVRQLEARVRELDKLSGFSAGDVPTRAAEVTQQPLSSFEHTMEINRGTSDGVHTGMAVIAGGTTKAAEGGQVMGRVVGTTGGSATVELVTEPSFQVGVRMPSGQIAIAQGQGRGRDLVVTGIPAEAKVAKGDAIETSGVDRSAFPANLEVGRVRSVRKIAGGDEVELLVQPLADLTSTYVRVALRQAPR